MCLKVYSCLWKTEQKAMSDKTDYIDSFDQYLRQGEPSRRESAANLGISLATLKRDISTLKQKGFVKREGSDKAGRWVAVRKP